MTRDEMFETLDLIRLAVRDSGLRLSHKTRCEDLLAYLYIHIVTGKIPAPLTAPQGDDHE